MWNTTCSPWSPTTSCRRSTGWRSTPCPPPIAAPSTPMQRSSPPLFGSGRTPIGTSRVRSRPTQKPIDRSCTKLAQPWLQQNNPADQTPRPRLDLIMTSDNWIDACATDDIDEEDVARFDYEGRTFAIYH